MSADSSAPPLSPKDPLSGRLAQLGEELHCALCLEYYDDPVALPCQHSFCRGCIRGAVRPVHSSSVNRQEVDCPLCRKKTQFNGSADACVENLQRNFHLAGIIEKFLAAEKEKERSEDEQFERQALEQIELSKKRQEQELLKVQQQLQELQVQQQQEQHQQQQQQQTQQLRQQKQEHQHHQKEQQPRFRQTTSTSENASCGPVPLCKTCPYPGVIHCSQCDDDFCLQCQQSHSHGETEEEFIKKESGPEPSGQDQDDQQRLEHLRQKQQILQLELDQQQVLSEFSPPTPLWHQQQANRWEELQKGTKRQVSEEYPPRHQVNSEVMSPGPLSWPLNQQDRQAYPQQHPQDIQQLLSTMAYPHPELHQQFSPTSLSPMLNMLNCSHCKFPAAMHCQQCSSYFCWQCIGQLHDPKWAPYHSHNVVELVASLSNPSSLDSEQLPPKHGNMPSTMPMIPLQLGQVVEAAPTPALTAKQKSVNFTIPYTCDIKGMGPGKCITVCGKPFKEKCVRFHVNLMCNKNLKSGDIALHFNPRFSFPKVIVRNTRIGGKYGSEERGGPSFPFFPGRSFKIKFTCHIDKFQVSVDGKPFITYVHRLKDLHSIKVFNVNGDVQITSVDGCM